MTNKADLQARPFASKHGTSFYGPGGSYQGSAVRNGNVTSFYDRNGSLTGAAVAPRR
jgi:hypothetical protein